MAKRADLSKNALDPGLSHPPPYRQSQPLSSRNIHPAEVKWVSSRGQACTQTCSLLLTLVIGLSGCVRAAKPLFIVSVKVRVGKDMSEIPMCHVHTAPLVLLSHCLERHKRQTSLLSLCKCSLVIFIPVLSGKYKGRVRGSSSGRQRSTPSLPMLPAPAGSRGTRASLFPPAPEQSVLLLLPRTPPGQPLPGGMCVATDFPSWSIPTSCSALVQPLPGQTAWERGTREGPRGLASATPLSSQRAQLVSRGTPAAAHLIPNLTNTRIFFSDYKQVKLDGFVRGV